MQTDVKKIIAYSSISHMNYAVLALFTLDLDGINSSLIYMLAHGLSSTALFYCIGIIYDRFNTRNLLQYQQLMNNYPLLMGFFFIFNLINIGFPLSYSFLAELTILTCLIEVNIFFVIIASISIFLSVIYSFWILHYLLLGLSKKN
jgi:NADH:ubiquinone oxidoreductase subunit 4 (subunit M)